MYNMYVLYVFVYLYLYISTPSVNLAFKVQAHLFKFIIIHVDG